MDSSVIYECLLSLCNRFIMSRLYMRDDQGEIENSMMDFSDFPGFPYFVKTRKIRKIRKIQCDIFVVDLHLASIVTTPIPLAAVIILLLFR